MARQKSGEQVCRWSRSCRCPAVPRENWSATRAIRRPAAGGLAAREDVADAAASRDAAVGGVDGVPPVQKSCRVAGALPEIQERLQVHRRVNAQSDDLRAAAGRSTNRRFNCSSSGTTDRTSAAPLGGPGHQASEPSRDSSSRPPAAIELDETPCGRSRRVRLSESQTLRIRRRRPIRPLSRRARCRST